MKQRSGIGEEWRNKQIQKKRLSFDKHGQMQERETRREKRGNLLRFQW